MEIDQKRLAQLLGMLGSNHDGEVVNAARLADRMVRQAGLTWTQVLDGGGYTKAFVQKIATEAYNAGKADGKPKPPRKSFAGYARFVLNRYDEAISKDPLYDPLTDWEYAFLVSWTNKSYPPSGKQLAVFTKIAEKSGIPIPADLWSDIA